MAAPLGGRPDGYYCVNVGKMHTSPYESPAGFHERYVVENKDRFLGVSTYESMGAEYYRALPDYKERIGAFEWNLPEELHSDMFVGDRACWWLEHKPKPAQPLFLQIGFPGPHPPFDPTPRRRLHGKGPSHSGDRSIRH